MGKGKAVNNKRLINGFIEPQGWRNKIFACAGKQTLNVHSILLEQKLSAAYLVVTA